MRPTAAAVFFAVCMGLLASQWSGVHTHINAEGFHGGLQGMHHHHHDDHHDHNSDNGDDGGDDIDVRVVDYGLSASKLLFLLCTIGLPLLLVSLVRDDAPIHRLTTLPLRRRARWRPPLRAPPLLVYT